MSFETEREKKRLNHFLLLGAINHTMFLSVLLFAYISSGFKASGDSYGGLMMVYAFSLFMPQLIFGIFTLITVARSWFKDRLTGANKKHLTSYFVTLFLVVAAHFAI